MPELVPVSKREAFEPIAREAAAKYGVDPDIFVRQIEHESAWNPQAVSKAGALGIAQFMPGTAKGFGIDPMDPVQSLDAAAKYMANGLRMFKGDYGMALAAYNAGAGAVQKYGGVPPFRETQNYVRSILGGNNPKVGKPSGSAPSMSPSTPGKLPGATLLPNPYLGDVQSNPYLNLSLPSPQATPEIQAANQQALMPFATLPTPMYTDIPTPQTAAQANRPFIQTMQAATPILPRPQAGPGPLAAVGGLAQQGAQAVGDAFHKEIQTGIQDGQNATLESFIRSTPTGRFAPGAVLESARLINGILSLPSDIANAAGQNVQPLVQIPTGDLEAIAEKSPVSSFVGAALPYALGEGAAAVGLKAVPGGAKLLQTLTATAPRRVLSGAAVNAAEGFLTDPGEAGGLEQRLINTGIGFGLGAGVGGALEGTGFGLAKLARQAEEKADGIRYQQWLSSREPLNSLNPSTGNQVIQVPASPVKVGTRDPNVNRFGVVQPEAVNHPGGTPVFYDSRKAAADAYNLIKLQDPNFVGDIKQTPDGAFVINDRKSPTVNQPEPLVSQTKATPDQAPAKATTVDNSLSYPTKDTSVSAPATEVVGPPAPVAGEAAALPSTQPKVRTVKDLITDGTFPVLPSPTKDGFPLPIRPEPSPRLDGPVPKVPGIPDGNLGRKGPESLPAGKVTPEATPPAKPQEVPPVIPESTPPIQTKVTPEQQTMISEGKAVTPEMTQADPTLTEQKINQAFEEGKVVTTQSGAEVFTGKSPDKTQAALADLSQAGEGGRTQLISYKEARQLIEEYLPDKMPFFEAFWQAGAEGKQLITNYRERVRGWAKGTVDEFIGRYSNGKTPGVEEFASQEQARVAAEAHKRLNPTHQVSDPYPVTKTIKRGKKQVEVTKWRIDAVGDRQIDPFGIGVSERNGEPFLYLLSYNYNSTKKGNVRGYRLGRMNETIEGFNTSQIGGDSPYGNAIQAIQKKADEARQHIIDNLPTKQALAIMADVDSGNMPAALDKLKKAVRTMDYEQAQNLEQALKAYCNL